MADIDITVATQDETSQKFRTIGRSVAEGMRDIEDAERREEAQTKKSEMAWAKKLLTYAAVLSAGKKLLDFSASAVKAYAEDEESVSKLSAALKQMGYESEGLTAVLDKQAQAFEQLTLVDDSVIRSMQQLMIRFGVAPKDIQATTDAVLDYAAATGQDAEAATMALLRAVENGGKGLSKLGVNIQETGDRTKDLAAAVIEMEKKFGGAAEAETQGLSGSLKRVATNFGILTENVGRFIATSEAGKGFIHDLNLGLQSLNETMSEEHQRKNTLATLNEKLLDQQARLAKFVEDRSSTFRNQESVEHEISLIEKRIVITKAEIKTMEDKALVEQRAAEEANMRKSRLAEEADAAQRQEAEDKARKERKKKEDEEFKKFSQELNEELAVMAEQDEDAWQQAERAREKAMQEQERALKKQQKDLEKHAHELQEQRETWLASGLALGGALIEGIESGMMGDEDAAGNFLIDALSVGTELVVSYYAGGTIGSAAGRTVRGIGKTVQKNEKDRSKANQKKHTGGPVYDDLPRFHDGGEVPAVLLEGEHVLSRSDVATMGGHPGVEAAKRGGSGGRTNIVLNVNAMDAGSFEAWMGSTGGPAIVRMMRRNEGEFSRELRRGR